MPDIKQPDDRDIAAEAGSGHSGPHDIGTRPQDVPTTLGADLGGPGSPTNRLWSETEVKKRRRREKEPEPQPVDLPIPPDNPGGPPPGSTS
jgi:hypothetical protein